MKIGKSPSFDFISGASFRSCARRMAPAKLAGPAPTKSIPASSVVSVDPEGEVINSFFVTGGGKSEGTTLIIVHRHVYQNSLGVLLLPLQLLQNSGFVVHIQKPRR